MPRYMFDTNMCIYLMQQQPPTVAARFAQCHVGDVVMSSITFAELEYGLSVCARPERERQALDVLAEMIEVLPFDINAARAYGPACRATRNRKTDYLDKLIAAHCISLGATLVTNNELDFPGYPGLLIENWLK
ncbi:MAG: type II toxin-antitoxin system VapC family toxin [Betaproteobacteria bacterium]|nr:type II toxin-antitoxin system VapC family toxin [Betaproteobacteria bacterium]